MSDINFWTLGELYACRWKSDPPPQLDQFLEQHGVDAATTDREQIAQTLIDLDMSARFDSYFGHRVGQAPSVRHPILTVEQYQKLLPFVASKELLLELIEIEAQHHQRYGGAVRLSEYGGRFPGLDRKEIERKLQPYTGSPGPLLEEFVWEGRIGRGGMGDVLLYRNERTDEPIALKIAKTDTGAMLVKEAETLRGLHHKNLICIRDLWPNAMRPYYTMDYIEGRHFEFDSFSDEAQQAFQQLVEVLDYMHSKDVIHRDIKPSNVLVRSGSVVLLDLGIAIGAPEGGRNEPTNQNRQGTPLFMSPEQMECRPVDANTDWYSVGVLLYQTLTGSYPFPENLTEAELLRRKLEPPRSPKQEGADISQELDTLCRRMLDPVPAARPKAAEILRVLGSVSPISLLPPPFWVPRTDAEEQLNQALQVAWSTKACGGTVIVAVRGSTGIGKTALVEKFIRDVRRSHNVLPLRGKCYSEGVHGTHGGFGSLTADLARFLERWAHEPARIRACLPEDTASLITLDVFQGLKSIVTASGARYDSAKLPADPVEQRRLAYDAYREFLCRFCRELSHTRPVVLFLDDLQWAGADSGELFNALFQQPDSPGGMVVYTFRDNEPMGPAVERIRTASVAPLPEIIEIQVSALTEPESRRLLHEQLLERINTLSDSTLTRLCEKADGNPFLLQRFAQAITAAKDMDNVDSLSGDILLETELSKLPIDQRLVMDLIAISGRPLDVSVVKAFGEFSERSTDVFKSLRSGGLINDVVRGRIDVYHDQFSAAALRRLRQTPAEYENLCLRWANMLRENSPHAEEYDLLATLYEQAKQFAISSDFYRMAAESARQRLRFDEAEQLQEKSISRSNLTGESLGKELIRHADLLACNGKASQAAAKYKTAADLIDGPERLRCRCQAAQRWLNCGNIHDGRDMLKQVFADCGVRYPSQRMSIAYLDIALELALLKLRGLAIKDPGSASPRKLHRLDALWAGVSGLAFIEPVIAAHLRLRYLRESLDCGHPRHSLRALITYAAFLAAISGKRRREQTDQVLQQVSDIGSRNLASIGEAYVRGTARLASGIAAHLQGRWQASIDDCEQAAEYLKADEDASWEIITAQTLSMWSCIFLGDVASLMKRQPARHKNALDRADLFAALNFGTRLKSFMRLSQDELEKSRAELKEEQSKLPPGGYYLQHHNHLVASTFLDLYAGDGLRAWERVKDAWGAYRAGRLDLVQQVRVDFWESYGRAAIAAASFDNRAAKPMAAVRHAIKKLEQEKIGWAQGSAALFRGGLALLQHDYPSAERALQTAESAFKQADMRLHAAAADIWRRRARRAVAIANISEPEAGRLFMQREGIVKPEAMAQAILPCQLPETR